MSSCALVFPCRNEEKAVVEVLRLALEAKRRILNGGYAEKLEIIAVNDNSTDGTAKVLKNSSRQIKIIHLKDRRGYGEAVKAGAEGADCEWIAFCDMDATCAPSDLLLLIEKARETSAPMVWGARLHGESAMPFLRKTGNFFYRGMIWLLSGGVSVADPCSGFRLFKKSVFTPAIFNFPSGLNFSPALTAYCIRKKIPFDCVNITYRKRIGKSKLRTLRDGWIFFWTLLYWLLLKKV